MKKILIIINTILVINATAQLPDYFSNNPEWRIDTQVFYTLPCGIERNMVYYINGDTILNNITYQKLYRRGIGSEFMMVPDEDPCNISWPFVEISAFIRQEFEKIYVLDIFSSTEELYYDFSMEVGDTIQGPMASWIHQETIKAVDSIEIAGEYLKRLYYDTIEENNFFLEGIGNPNGFLEAPQLDVSEFGSILFCYRQNDSVVYTFDGWEEECDFTISVKEYRTDNFEFTIFPNPSSEKITISVPGQNKHNWVRIYNTSGQLLIEKPMITNTMQLDLSELANGMYLLEAETEDGFRQVKQFSIAK